MRHLLIVLCLSLLGAGLASADQPTYGPPIGIEQAKKLAAKAATSATKNQWTVAIAIVDTHGFLTYYEMMDGTQLGSGQVAIDKARAAALFRRATKSFQEGVTANGSWILGISEAVPIDGGLPIVIAGKVVGAIGVSGADPDEDARVASDALEGLK